MSSIAVHSPHTLPMFNIFKSGFKPDYLSTAKQKLRDLIALHLKTLAMQRYAGITVDAYGNVDGSKWNAEAQYFLDKLLLPRLSNEERQAVLTAGLSAIGQEFVETPVRDECSRMHAAGEHDMTVRRLHPPDSRRKPTEAPRRKALVGASLTGIAYFGLPGHQVRHR